MSGTKTYTFEVDPMTCSGCTRAVESALNKLGGMNSINFNLETKTVVVETDKSSEQIMEAITSIGKTAKLC